MSTNYVLVSWAGPRRVNPLPYREDPSCLLRKHLESLENLRHSLDQITVVVNLWDQEPPAYRRAIEGLPKTIRRARVEVLERKNVGYSYGAYADVFERYRSAFRTYLFMEDDYRFTQHGFDGILTDVLERDGAGFVTFMLRNATRDWIMTRARRESPRGEDVARTLERVCPVSFVYPQVCLGLARARTLEGIRERFGRLPHSTGNSHHENKFEGQFALVAAIQKIGWKLSDMTNFYRVKEHGPGGEVNEAGPTDRPFIVEPIQPSL